MNLTGAQVAGKYELKELVYESAMIYVYKGMDIESNKTVALKLLKPEKISNRLEDTVRFQKITNKISKLDHPNLVRIYEYYPPAESLNLQMHCTVMEFIQGMRLKEQASRQKFSINETCEIICQVCNALVQVHSNGVVHGDIKPDNIMFMETDKNQKKIHIKLIDFGLSIIKKTTDDTDRLISGTYLYMSPEQTGLLRRNIDERSDLYSLGLVFYELLAGRLPFDSSSLVKLLHEQLAKIPDPPSKTNKDIPVILDRMVQRLLEKEPDKRYQTASGLLHDLEQYLSGKHEFQIGQADSRSRIDFSRTIVGRNKELKTLLELHKESLESKGRICFLTGEAGIGKSRLMEEARNRITAEGGTCIEGTALRESKSPHGMFYEAITDYMNRFRSYDKDRQNAISQAVQKECRNLGQIIIDFNPRVKAILGECPEIIKLEPEREVQRFYMIMAKFFLCLANAEHGLVLLLNDLHWSDIGSIKLAEEIIRNIEDAPLFVIGSLRESELYVNQPWKMLFSGNETAEKLALNELDKNAVNILLNSIFSLREEDNILLTEFVHAKSAGNPLFIQEIVKELITEEVLFSKDDAWQLNAGKLRTTEIPETVLDSLLKRVQVFSKEEADILSAASVIGRSFDNDLLIGVMTNGRFEKKADIVIGVIDRAIEMQILTKGTGSDYSFSHDRVRDAFYERMPVKKRKELHNDIGTFLEEKYKDNKDPVIFDLAYHFMESGDEDKILKYAYPAGIKASSAFANEDAIRYFQFAREILQRYLEESEQYRQQWIECTMKLGETLHLTGLPDESIALMQELLPFMQTKVDKALIYLQISQAYSKKFDYVSVKHYVRTGLAILDEKMPLTKRGLIIQIIKEVFIHLLMPLFILPNKIIKRKNEKYKIILGFYLSLFLSVFLGDSLNAAWLVLRMLNISQNRIGPSRELALSILCYGAMLMQFEFPILSINEKKTCHEYLKKSYDFLSGVGDTWGIANILCMKYTFHTFYNEYKIEIKNCEKDLNVAERVGDIYLIIALYIPILLIHYYLSNYIDAKNIYNICKKYAIDDYIKITMFGLGYPSKYYIENGDFFKAEEELKKQFEIASVYKQPYLYCMICIFFGILNTEEKKFEKAIIYFNEAHKYILDGPKVAYYVLFSNYTQHLVQHFIIKKNDLSGKEYKKKCKEISYSYSKIKNRKDKWLCFTCIVPREMGNFYASLNKPRKARKFYNQAIEICDKIGRRYELARTYYDYGVFLKQTGDKLTAWQNLTASYLLFEEIGITTHREKIALILGFRPDTDKTAESPVFRERMKHMIERSRDIAAIEDVPALLDAILSLAMELTGARNAYIFIADDEDGKLMLQAEKHVDVQTAGDYSWNIVNSVFESGEPVIAADASADKEISLYRSVAGQKLKSVLCVPVKHNDIMSGVCYLDNPLSGGVFMEEEERLLSIMLINSAMAIENLMLHERLRSKDAKLKLKTPASERQYLEKAIKYIETHYSEEMHRESISGILNINTEYLGRVFKSGTGKTVQEYVNEVRIKEAADRLIKTDAKIIDVAMDTGFDSVRTFNRVFYRIMGITPSQYREKIS